MKISSICKYSASDALVSLFLISNYANAQNAPAGRQGGAPRNQPNAAMPNANNAPRAQGQMGQARQEVRDNRMEGRQEMRDNRMEKRQEMKDNRMEKREEMMKGRQEMRDNRMEGRQQN
jgi:hypothetical protein